MTSEFMEFDENSRIDLRLLYHLSNKGILHIIKWSMMMKLIPKKYKCPECGKDMILSSKKSLCDKYVWSCRDYGENRHYIKRSLRKHSWFYESKLTIMDILMISYFWIKKASYDFVIDELGCARNTVIDRYLYCQQLCFEICKLESEVLGGEDIKVEIYETKVKLIKNLRFEFIAGTWLIIGFEKEHNKYFLQVCSSSNEDGLFNAIKDWILPGSIIISSNTCLADKQCKYLERNQNLTFEPKPKTCSISKDSLFSIVKNAGKNSNVRNVFILHLVEDLWRQGHKNDFRSLIKSFFKNLPRIFPPQECDYMD